MVFRRRGQFDVLIVGPYPPPLGGVSSHVRQVALELRAAGYRLGVIDHFGGRRAPAPVVASLRRNPARYLFELPRWRSQVVHYHHAGRTSILLSAALARRARRQARWVITVHNRSLTPDGPPTRVRSRLIRWALNQFDHVIAVSREVQLGLAEYLPGRAISVLPAFAGVEEAGTGSLEEETRRFVVSGGATLIISAYRVRLDRSGGDIYGLGFAAQLFESLAAEIGDLRLALFLARGPHNRATRRYVSESYRRLERAYPGRIRLAIGEPLVPAFGPTTIYLRPTQTDGDAVSVREALALGVPVLASDVAARPHGVRTLSLSDRSQWIDAIRESATVAGSARPRPRPRQGPNEDLATLLSLYDRLVAGPNE